MIAPPLTALEVPLRIDETNTIRVGNTRVILDLVIDAFKKGESPKRIVEMYDALNLTEVFTAITYYLQHQAELDTYFQHRREEAAALQREIESQPGYREHRADLMARMDAKRREKQNKA